MKCKICNSETKSFFTRKVLKKYDVQYFSCSNCGFIFTENPYWLDEAYESAITKVDTGILWRNNLLSKQVSIILFYLFDKNAKFLDYAGGLGIFTRLMRDIGFDFYWDDLYSKNELSRGFEYDKCLNINAITSFEAFEHFENSINEIEKMLEISPNIIFSTELQPKPNPNPDEWWYYLFDTGQHINFYSIKTLQYLAQTYGLYFYSLGWIHIFSKKKLNKKFFKLRQFLFKINMLDKYENYLFEKIKKEMKPKYQEDMEYMLLNYD